MFQWGRKADGHELMDWTSATAGTRKYGETDTANDNPSDSLFITKYSDWRVTPDDTLWANESSPNNVCPVGYRLPLNPNGAVDAENELAVELNSWDSKDVNGSMSSDLKLTTAGGLTSGGAITWWTPGYGIYWTGSVVPSDGNNSTVSNARDMYFGNALGLLDTSGRGLGYSVRCIKQFTMEENASLPANIKIDWTSLEANVVSIYDNTPYTPAIDIQGVIDSGPNTVTIEIPYTVENNTTTLPAYSTTYTIDAADTEDGVADIVATFSWSEQSNLKVGKDRVFNATITTSATYNAKKLDAEDDRAGRTVATFNYPTDDAGSTGTVTLKVIPGILDRNFNVQTNGEYQHQFIYASVTSHVTGRVWLNNNLGADYADMNNSAFNPTQQATAIDDYKAYGSSFQWGRKADGHELINWISSTEGTRKYGRTGIRADEPSNPLFIWGEDIRHDWRVNQDDTLWASESNPNNVCPVGYKVPEDLKLTKEIKHWSSADSKIVAPNVLKLPAAGMESGQIIDAGELGVYWSSTPMGSRAMYTKFLFDIMFSNWYRDGGRSVRCIKD